jgi:glycosyltransferase involved in cell wall biosynthesis
MKVFFLAGTLGRGGAEKQLTFMIEAAQNAGIETKVFSLTKGESCENDIRSLGVPVEWVGQSHNRFVRLANIVRVLKKESPDILQSSHFFTNIYAGLAGSFLNIPSIGAVRSDLISEMRIHGPYGKWQVKMPRFLIANSGAAYKKAIKRGVSPKNIAFVRNVVRVSNQSKNPIPKKALTFLFAGRLDELKRPDRFLDLAQVLTARFPEISMDFILAGDGELRQVLESRVAKMGSASGKVEFTGICEDMDGLYRRSNILVSTSVREGTSNVILEALAHGLPVIATRVGGTPEILGEGRGMLTRPDNQADLIKAAEALIFNPALRETMAVAGRRYVESHHSMNYLKRHLTGIYADLLNH